MRHLTQKLRLISLVSIGLVYNLPQKAQAQSIDFPTEFAGLPEADIKITIGNIVKIVIGFLGILAVVAIIFGGFKMMTSFGEVDKNADGKKVFTAGVIGLIIVLASYAIASFVVNNLANAINDAG